MKSIKISIVTLVALSSMAVAGGDFLPVIEYETNDFPIVIVEEVQEEILVKEVVKTLDVIEKKKAIEEPVSNSNWYVGAGLVRGIVAASNCEDVTYGVMLKAGYDINSYFGMEARALKTNWRYEGSKIKHVGLFLKPMFPVNEDINLYGLVGYAKTKTGNQGILNENSLALGTGVAYALNEKKDINLFVDYERLLVKNNVPDIDAISLGLSIDF